MVTPVNADALDSFLQGYPEELKQELVEGFANGFSIRYSGPDNRQQAPNLKTAINNPQVVDSKLAKEVGAGRLSGPFQEPPFDSYVISPVGVEPKKVPGEFRLIHHLSFPRGRGWSVNGGIPEAESSVKYASIDDAVAIIQKLGRGCWMAKCDIKSAFRIIPIRPSERHLLGLRWRGLLYFDNCLPMGCSSSCALFEKLSTALQWIAVTKLNIKNMLHVLDDFLILARSRKECLKYLHSFLQLCSMLGIPMAPEKTIGPLQKLDFVGLEMDSVNMSLRLPPEKISKYLASVTGALEETKLSLRALQVLTGQLNFAATVVVAGRVFLRRVYRLMCGLTSPFMTVQVPDVVKADLYCWREFLRSYNGITIFPSAEWYSSATIGLTFGSNTSQFWGSFNNEWFCRSWVPEAGKPEEESRDFYALLSCLLLWGHRLSNRKILFLTVSRTTSRLMNKLKSKAMITGTLIRQIHLVCMVNNIVPRAKSDPGLTNLPPQLLLPTRAAGVRRDVPHSVYPGRIASA